LPKIERKDYLDMEFAGKLAGLLGVGDSSQAKWKEAQDQWAATSLFNLLRGGEITQEQFMGMVQRGEINENALQIFRNLTDASDGVTPQQSLGL